jgi:hypothetical protein
MSQVTVYQYMVLDTYRIELRKARTRARHIVSWGAAGQATQSSYLS